MVDDETFDEFYAKLRWHLGIAFLALRILSFFFFFGHASDTVPCP